MSDAFAPLQNDLFLKALRGEAVPRPPVWMMRQAGRYLPEYRALQAKHDFFTRVQTPELACEITLQPIDIIGTDAAIIFSDILVTLQALGVEVLMEPGRGPVLPEPIQTTEAALKLQVPDVDDTLHYVMAALTLTRHELNGRVPLIGFAGAPWTLFCYLVEGHGSRDFATAKAFAFNQPEATEHILGVLTELTIAYLNAQIKAGAQAVQVFDSWAGLLGPTDFQVFSLPYLKRIVEGVKAESRTPIILFAKGAWYGLKQLSETGTNALGLDWTIPPTRARDICGKNITLQGNLDPTRLLSPPTEIRRRTKKMIENFGLQRYVVNLGHGMLPNIPVDHAKAFVETVKGFGG